MYWGLRKCKFIFSSRPHISLYCLFKPFSIFLVTTEPKEPNTRQTDILLLIYLQRRRFSLQGPKCSSTYCMHVCTVHRLYHGLITYTKAKCRHLKNWPIKGLYGRCISVWGTLSSWIFAIGDLTIFWFLNRSRYRVLNSSRNGIQQNSTPPPLPATHFLHLLYFDTGKGGESWTREKLRGATVHKAGSKIPTWLTEHISNLWTLINTCRLHCEFRECNFLLQTLRKSFWEKRNICFSLVIYMEIIKMLL